MALCLVWPCRNLSHALSLSLKKKQINSELIHRKWFPLTLTVLKGHVIQNIHIFSIEKICTLGINWYLSQLIAIKSLRNKFVFNFLYCLKLINFGGNLGNLIFHTQYTIEWSLKQSVIIPALINLLGCETSIQSSKDLVLEVILVDSFKSWIRFKLWRMLFSFFFFLFLYSFSFRWLVQPVFIEIT